MGKHKSLKVAFGLRINYTGEASGSCPIGKNADNAMNGENTGKR